MAPKDSFNKLIFQTSTFIKDTVSRNLIQARNAKLVKIDDDAIGRILNIVDSAIDEAVQRSVKNAEKTIDTIVLDVRKQLLADKETLKANPKKG